MHNVFLFLHNSCTLIAAPAGAHPIAHICAISHKLWALEKGKAIACEQRLAVSNMTNSHSQRLHVTAH